MQLLFEDTSVSFQHTQYPLIDFFLYFKILKYYELLIKKVSVYQSDFIKNIIFPG